MDSHYDHVFCFSPLLTDLINRAKNFVKKILEDEVGLSCTRGYRFYFNSISYPIQVIVFEHPTRLGYFDPALFEIGIHKICLLHDDLFLKELLRHEIAHYLTFLTHQDEDTPHGIHFQNTCKRYGWDKEKKAKIQLDQTTLTQKASILQKVEKLLSLSKSSNVHEANTALEMAQSLLLKHRLSFVKTEQEFVVKRVIHEKRTSAKLSSLSSILRQFFVYPVINHGKERVYLEIFGHPLDVEVGEYIALFLYHKFDLLWEEEQRKNPFLKGLLAKNSFFQGIGDGFIKKSLKNTPYQKALVATEKSLLAHAPLAYPHLRNNRGTHRIDPNAHSLGKKAGSLIDIPSGISSRKVNSPLLT